MDISLFSEHERATLEKWARRGQSGGFYESILDPDAELLNVVPILARTLVSVCDENERIWTILKKQTEVIEKLAQWAKDHH